MLQRGEGSFTKWDSGPNLQRRSSPDWAFALWLPGMRCPKLKPYRAVYAQALGYFALLPIGREFAQASRLLRSTVDSVPINSGDSALDTSAAELQQGHPVFLSELNHRLTRDRCNVPPRRHESEDFRHMSSRFNHFEMSPKLFRFAIFRANTRNSSDSV